MMRNDFIKVTSLEGELKLSQIKKELKRTVTTKEIILQKPHHSYHIKLTDIFSVVPLNLDTRKIPMHFSGEKVLVTFSPDLYKISANKMRIFNRQGITERGQTEVIVPLTKKFLAYMVEYGGLTVIE